LSRPFPSRNPPPPLHRINGKIRAREVRVIGPDGQQVGVIPLGQAIVMAQNAGLDLVEIAATAIPPVCRIVDYGKFKYEQSKKEREGKKHQHSSEVKEIQLSPTIDPHDLGIKKDHATDFLCEDMKVKVSLRFRGRQMAHTEIGMGVVEKFLRELALWGHPDNQPKLVGRSINVMISPLPKQKRAKHPKDAVGSAPAKPTAPPAAAPVAPKPPGGVIRADRVPTDAALKPATFGGSPFAGLEIPPPAR
jgi:translation initiation factor IF-3